MSFDVTPTPEDRLAPLPPKRVGPALERATTRVTTHVRERGPTYLRVARATGRWTWKALKATWPFWKWCGRVLLWIVIWPYGLVRSIIHGRRKHQRRETDRLIEALRPPVPPAP